MATKAATKGDQLGTALVRVAYDGELLRHGTMDVRDLAPALLALGELCTAANKVVNGSRAEARVSVRAEFKRGSFGIAFDVEQVGGFVQAVRGFLTSDDVSAVINAKDLVGILLLGVTGGGSLIQLVRKAKGKRLKSKVMLASGMVRIETQDGLAFEFTPPVVELYESLPVRKALTSALEPLKKEGIDTFLVHDSDHVAVEQIGREELPSFALPDLSDAPANVAHFDAYYVIQSLTFKDDNKWRLASSSGTIFATIEDAEFLRRVDTGTESFRKNDSLLCRIRLSQWRTANGLREEYVVEKVLEHVAAATQMEIALPAQPGGRQTE